MIELLIVIHYCTLLCIDIVLDVIPDEGSPTCETARVTNKRDDVESRNEQESETVTPVTPVNNTTDGMSPKVDTADDIDQNIVEQIKQEKLQAKLKAERDKQILAELDADRIAQEEAQKQERWRVKEMQRLARQQAKMEAEREAARISAEIEKKKRDEEAKVAKEEEDSYEMLLKQMAARGLKVPEQEEKEAAEKAEKKSAAAGALTKLLEAQLQRNGTKTGTPAIPAAAKSVAVAVEDEAASTSKPIAATAFHHNPLAAPKGPRLSAPPRFPAKQIFASEGHGISPFSDVESIPLSLNTASYDDSSSEFESPQMSLASMLKARFALNSPPSEDKSEASTPIPNSRGGHERVPNISPPSQLDSPNSEALDYSAVYALPSPSSTISITTSPMHTLPSRPQSAAALSALSSLLPQAQTNPLLETAMKIEPKKPAITKSTSPVPFKRSSFTATDELKIKVKSATLHAPVLNRRLRLWALTQGFLFTSAANINKSQFEQALNSSSDRSLRDCNIDINAMEDWNQLVDALRASERAHSNQQMAEDLKKEPILLDIEATLQSPAVSSFHHHHQQQQPKPPIAKADLTIKIDERIASIASKVSKQIFVRFIIYLCFIL